MGAIGSRIVAVYLHVEGQLHHRGLVESVGEHQHRTAPADIHHNDEDPVLLVTEHETDLGHVVRALQHDRARLYKARRRACPMRLPPCPALHLRLGGRDQQNLVVGLTRMGVVGGGGWWRLTNVQCGRVGRLWLRVVVVVGAMAGAGVG